MRVKENDGQEVTFEDLNRIMQLVERNAYERTLNHLVDKQADGVFQDSFFVDFSDATHVSVRAGVGVQEDLTQVHPETTRRLLYRPTATVLLIAAADVTNPRKDIVVMKHNRVDTVSQSRNIKDFITSIVTPQTIVVETDWLSDLLVVTGTAAPVPTEPSIPAGYKKIAVVNVPATTGPTSQANITDSRVLLPILENTNIDTSGFSSVATLAVDTPLKTVLQELDVLGASAAQTLLIYDAIVGAATGCTHATIPSAVTSVSAGARILVVDSFALTAAIAINKLNLEIHLKPGVVISKSSATTGFDVQAGGGGFELHGGKISGFGTGGDKAVAFDAAATYGKVWGVRFSGNVTNVDDSLVDVVQFGNIEE